MLAASTMIDLHCHFLWGVDDGAQTLDEALALARHAVDDGIAVCALTPHIHPGRYENTRCQLEPHVEAFRLALADAGIPLEVKLAGEVRLSMESLELLIDGNVPFLGELDGYRILLLEFPHQTIPVGSLQFVDKLLQMKIRPLIAHPERNKSIMAEPDRLLPYLDRGCGLQLTAGSIVGRFGEESRKAARHMLENAWVEVIATDAHNLRHRPPQLKEGYIAAAEIIGEKQALHLVQTRPAQILGML